MIFFVPLWILLKYQPYHQLGPVITTFYQKSPYLFSGIMFEKRESAIGQQQKACSMLIVSVKSFFQHGGFVKVQIKKPFGDQIRPATILFQDSITSKHAVSPQFLLVSYVAIPLSCFFFLKHYVETKEKTGRVLYRATAKMSKKCSLPMMPLREIWVQSVRSKV